MNSFTAIDFETAQGYRWSICQVGLVRVEDGVVTEQRSLLVRPPENYYWSRFVDIHGITPEQTADAPAFDAIWEQVAPFITNRHVVAHNGFGFDFPCLEQTLAYYHLPAPAYTGHCTYQIFRKNLAALCQEHKIPLNHHDALSDAMACARLYLRYLSKKAHNNGN